MLEAPVGGGDRAALHSKTPTRRLARPAPAARDRSDRSAKLFTRCASTGAPGSSERDAASEYVRSLACSSLHEPIETRSATHEHGRGPTPAGRRSPKTSSRSTALRACQGPSPPSRGAKYAGFACSGAGAQGARLALARGATGRPGVRGRCGRDLGLARGGARATGQRGRENDQPRRPARWRDWALAAASGRRFDPPPCAHARGRKRVTTFGRGAYTRTRSARGTSSISTGRAPSGSPSTSSRKASLRDSSCSSTLIRSHRKCETPRALMCRPP